MVRHRNHILVVDDEPSVRDSVSRILERYRYHTETACCGREAIEKAASFRPDVVLLDIIMPGIDGYETCRQLRNMLPDIKVVYFTAKLDVEYVNTGVDEKVRADAIIEKPANSEKILVCLDQVLMRS